MKDGDFILIEYVGRISNTNEIFDLTSAELAKKEGIFNKNFKYGPKLVIVGSNMVIKGVEAKLKEMNLNDEKEFEVTAAQAFGKRNPKMIKIISISKFLEKNINPTPGLFVDIDGIQAKIQSVSGGRVRVDFNHPLAGKDLKYKLKIVKVFKEKLDKVKAILNYYGIEAETTVKEDILTIKPKKKLEFAVEKLVSETIKKWVKFKNVKIIQPKK